MLANVTVLVESTGCPMAITDVVPDAVVIVTPNPGTRLAVLPALPVNPKDPVKPALPVYPSPALPT
jgi:hypothetical protein